MRQKLQTLLFALVAMMMPIGAWAQQQQPLKLYSGVATLYTPFDVQLDEDTHAYVVTDVKINEDGSVQLVEEELPDGKIPANTAVILRNAKQAQQTTLKISGSSLEQFITEEANLLKGTLVPRSLDVSDETGNFALYGEVSSDYWLNIADWQAHSNNGTSTYTLGANKAYLQLPVEPWSSKLAALKALPHLQHTHGGCEICGQVTEVSWGATADALTSYGTLDEAFAAAAEEGIGYIQLLSDIANDNGYSISGGTFTLDLNGKTLTSEGFTLTFYGGAVTITDGSENKTGKVITTAEGCATVYVNDESTVSIDGGWYESVNTPVVDINTGSFLTITGGEFAVTSDAEQIIANNEDCTLSITGGTFDAKQTIYALSSRGTTTVSGGTFKNTTEADVLYFGGRLTFDNDPRGVCIRYWAEDNEINEIILPGGYGFYDANDEAVTDFQNGLKCYIGKEEEVGFTVTFHGNNGTEETTEETVESPTGKYALPECDFNAPEGMMFDGWQVGDDEENLYQPGDVIIITADTEVTAVWGDIKIVINMYDSGDDGWDGASITVKKDGEELDEPVTIEDGTEATVTLVYDLDSRYTFYWNMGSYDGECEFEIIVNGETKYTGSGSDFSDDIEFFFALGDPFVVSFNANEGSGSMDDIETYESSVTLPECTFTAPEGMMFDVWQVGDDEENLYQPGEEITVTADTEIKAVWTEFVPQIVINMSDSGENGWEGASITVMEDGKELGTATVEEDFDTNTVTFTYDSTCEYTFYWTKGACDYECSFEIIVNGENVFEASQYESESGIASDCEGFTTEEPFFTLEATAIAEAKWGTSADALTEKGTLFEAVDAAGIEDSNIGYIKLLADVEEEIYVNAGTFTLDLNGHTISSELHTLYIQNNSNVTIVDGSETKSGKVISSGEGSLAVCVDDGASVTINGGTYESTLHYALNVQGENSSVTINGGSYESPYLPVFIHKYCSATIVGGTFKYTGANAIENFGNLVVKGGTFTYDGDVDPDSNYPTISYLGGSIDLSDYPTDAINSIDVTNNSGEDITPGAETILLPEGYCFFAYSDDTPVTVLEYGAYYIGEEPTKYTIAFDAGDGEGEMEGEIIYEGDYTLPECIFTAPEGMMFKAWLVGVGEYQPGEVVTIEANTTITAVWTEFVPQIVINMSDSYGDGWNGASITVKKDGEELEMVSVEEGYTNTTTITYDPTCEYTFYWNMGECDNECSFEIIVNGKKVFEALQYESESGAVSDCEDLTTEEPFFTLEIAEATEIESLTIADGELTEYSAKLSHVGTLTYTRTLPNLVWNALYVPFEIPMSELAENYDVAYINDVHSYDNNEDGEIDDLKMEVIKITTGTLNANYPYLIRAKNEEAKEMNLELTDATLYTTEVNTVSCSSVFMQFDVTGTYSQMSSEDLDGSLVITSDGSWKQLAESSVLRPFRLYLTMTAIDGSPVKVSEQAARSMRIVARGESEGTTSIDNGQWTIDNEPAVIYDLMGRRVLEPQKGGIYIVDGKKVVW